MNAEDFETATRAAKAAKAARATRAETAAARTASAIREVEAVEAEERAQAAATKRAPDAGASGGGDRRLLWLGSAALVSSEPSLRALARTDLIVCDWAEAGEAQRAFVQALPDLVVVDARSRASDAWALVGRIGEISGVPIVVVGRDSESRATSWSARLGFDPKRVVEIGERDLAQLASIVAGLCREAPGAAGARRSGGTTRTDGRAERLTAAQVRSQARAELRDALERELVACRGNLAEVGRRLGKDRSTVRYHLRRFGMLGDEALELHEGPSSRPECAPQRGFDVTPRA